MHQRNRGSVPPLHGLATAAGRCHERSGAARQRPDAQLRAGGLPAARPGKPLRAVAGRLGSNRHRRRFVGRNARGAGALARRSAPALPAPRTQRRTGAGAERGVGTGAGTAGRLPAQRRPVLPRPPRATVRGARRRSGRRARLFRAAPPLQPQRPGGRSRSPGWSWCNARTGVARRAGSNAASSNRTISNACSGGGCVASGVLPAPGSSAANGATIRCSATS